LKTNTEKIEASAKKKDEGNVWFKMGKYAKASKRYEKVKWQRRIHKIPVNFIRKTIANSIFPSIRLQSTLSMTALSVRMRRSNLKL